MDSIPQRRQPQHREGELVWGHRGTELNLERMLIPALVFWGLRDLCPANPSSKDQPSTGGPYTQVSACNLSSESHQEPGRAPGVQEKNEEEIVAGRSSAVWRVPTEPGSDSDHTPLFIFQFVFILNFWGGGGTPSRAQGLSVLKYHSW